MIKTMISRNGAEMCETSENISRIGAFLTSTFSALSHYGKFLFDLNLGGPPAPAMVLFNLPYKYCVLFCI